MTTIELETLRRVHGGNVFGDVARTMGHHYVDSGRYVASTMGSQYRDFGRALVGIFRR